MNAINFDVTIKELPNYNSKKSKIGHGNTDTESNFKKQRNKNQEVLLLLNENDCVKNTFVEFSHSWLTTTTDEILKPISE